MHRIFLVLLFTSFTLFAQKPQKPNASEIYHNLQKLNFIGSALYIAAHPDDENQRLISYFANDLKARAAYLSLTRGDGGQNLVGPEIRELLGVIRSQELLAARRTDGGEQLFTRANDFGYSKHPDETLRMWNKEAVLGDVVRAIRKFKPDVIVNRFYHGNPGSTHGHHTSSAMLSFEAFDLVGDSNEYPDSAQKFGAWQPKRLFFNAWRGYYGGDANFENADKSNLIQVDVGGYYPSLGLSNGEIASLSRSMHKSQGFGSTGFRGSRTEYLEFLKGEFPSDKTNLFDGINTTWSRLEGGKEIGDLLYPLEESFDFKDPSQILPDLLKAYELVKTLKNDHWREIKMDQLERLILNCSGVFLEAVAETSSINQNQTYNIKLEAINRSIYNVVLQTITDKNNTILATPSISLTMNKREQFDVALTSSPNQYSTPYWLNEKGSLGMYKAPTHLIGEPETPSSEKVIFNIAIGRTSLAITRNVIYKYNDPVKGEVYKPLNILPEVTSRISEKVLIFSNDEPREIPVIVRAGRNSINGVVTLQHPKGWIVTPAQQTYEIENLGEEQTLTFKVQPPNVQSEGFIRPLVQLGDGFFDKELITIDYDHIPFQSVLMSSEAKVVRIDIEKKGELIGYIDGAGDAIPESLNQIGYDVNTIAPNEITQNNLNQYDAIVVGIRAYNTVPELAFKQSVFNNYVAQGGNIIIQYNTSHRLVTKDLAPYSLSLSRDRVTDENSVVNLLAPSHPVLNSPNKISLDDFEGWVQERGLYFPNKWDPAFTPILGMNDSNYPETNGSLLVAKHGSGHYIYTGLSFFRELPAGVPGAYRLFANLLSLGK